MVLDFVFSHSVTFYLGLCSASGRLMLWLVCTELQLLQGIVIRKFLRVHCVVLGKRKLEEAIAWLILACSKLCKSKHTINKLLYANYLPMHCKIIQITHRGISCHDKSM